MLMKPALLLTLPATALFVFASPLRAEEPSPAAGMLVVEDLETGEVIEVDSTRETVREAFAAGVARRQEHLDRALMQSGVDILRLGAADDHAAMLQHFFEHRRRR